MKKFGICIVLGLAGSLFGQGASAQENCQYIYSGGCTSTCGQKAGQSAVKETLTCSACSQFCYAWKATNPEPAIITGSSPHEGVAYSSVDNPKVSQVNPLHVEPSILYSIAQVNPLAAIALTSLGSKNAPNTFSLISGKMSILKRPTAATVALKSQNASDEEQINSLVPLNDSAHHLEVVWTGMRPDPHTLVMRFETKELDSMDVPVSRADSDVEVVIKDGNTPHAVSWTVR